MSYSFCASLLLFSAYIFEAAMSVAVIDRPPTGDDDEWIGTVTGITNLTLLPLSCVIISLASLVLTVLIRNKCYAHGPFFKMFKVLVPEFQHSESPASVSLLIEYAGVLHMLFEANIVFQFTGGSNCCFLCFTSTDSVLRVQDIQG